MMNEDIFYKRLMNTDFVYHYTSIEAVLSILEGYRGNGQVALPFRASCAYNSNDPREMELGYSTIKKILPEYERSCDMSIDLSEVYKNAEYENQCKKRFMQKPKNGMVENADVPYIISFSCKQDFLPMWSMYGNDKKGACLKFNLGSLIDEWKVSNTDLCFVYYEGETENIINNHLLHSLYRWEAILNGASTKKLTIDDKIQGLSILCDCISPFIKTKDWAYESEFRIVKYMHYGAKLDEDFIKNNKHVLPKLKIDPHFTLQIPASSLEEIIVGPLANYNVWEHVLLTELKDCGLSNVVVSPSDIKITK